MNQLRDNYALGIAIIRSLALLYEMEKVVQDGSEIAAAGKGKDDRTFAYGLANKAYIDRLRAGLIARGETFLETTQREAAAATSPQTTMVASVVANFFKLKEAERERTAIDKAWKDAGLVI